MLKHVYFICVIGVFFSSNQKDSKQYVWQPKEVTASAYNSVPNQTNSNPNITAFGDTLVPGMKYIAVSNDLLKIGLKHNTLVTLEGFKGVFLVKDRMHERWKNHIDIYMGTDVKAAKEWGRKKLKIKYRLEVKDSI